MTSTAYKEDLRTCVCMFVYVCVNPGTRTGSVVESVGVKVTGTRNRSGIVIRVNPRVPAQNEEIVEFRK